jgi:hypothetical protein
MCSSMSSILHTAGSTAAYTVGTADPAPKESFCEKPNDCAHPVVLLLGGCDDEEREMQMHAWPSLTHSHTPGLASLLPHRSRAQAYHSTFHHTHIHTNTSSRSPEPSSNMQCHVNQLLINFCQTLTLITKAGELSIHSIVSNHTPAADIVCFLTPLLHIACVSRFIPMIQMQMHDLLPAVHSNVTVTHTIMQHRS